jgi:hypothetical protein
LQASYGIELETLTLKMRCRRLGKISGNESRGDQEGADDSLQKLPFEGPEVRPVSTNRATIKVLEDRGRDQG